MVEAMTTAYESEEQYTVAGHSVTLNKGKKTDGTDWIVTFKNGKSKPLSDVLSLIKPMPKGITMNEAKSISDYKVGDVISFKDGEDWKVMKVKDNVGKLVIKPHNEKAKKGNVSLEIDIDADYLKKNLSEAKEEDAVDTITMDIPLFLRMLEYSREDAKKDLDLHDVTEKANKLGKEKGILSMEDYDAIVSAAEEIQEVNLKQSKLSSAEYQKAKKLKDFKASDWKYDSKEDLYTKVNEGMGGQLDEPYFIEVSVRDARKALDLFDDQYSKSNIKMYGSNVYAANTPEDIYDLYYDLTSQDIEVLDYNVEDEELDEAELYEAYVPSNIKEFAKRKGVSSLVNKVAGWAEKVGKGIRGGTAIGYNYSTLILDMTHQGSEIRINTDDDTIELYDEPVYSFNDFKQVYLDNQEESDNSLEERIAEALNKINEELCPAGKAYIKRRKAAGEKSSAYLSGRAVKVCKGQMSGKSKKK